MNVAGKVLLVFLEAGLNKVLEYKEQGFQQRKRQRKRKSQGFWKERET